MLLDTDNRSSLRSQRSMVRQSIATMRVLLGLFFILSGIANYLYFNAPGGFFETVTQLKLKLWGWGFEGIGPMPAILAYPYAYLLPATEMIVGTLFVINRWVRWAGIIMMLMLLSFILAFGLIGSNGLLPNNQGNWDKNVFMLLGAWICAAYDHYLVTRKEQSNGF
ncbi:DoxX family membrane protein [Phormidesmis priestleyi ULC007]|uniref:DoxX family membrane protein n=1 Tax=Phormidesmis priestleyi ULC007 TaxID=1920490 RepID=A0A2T1D5G4_9CYAN|nr:MauE/DoxX family redox-associated membrane protein [Phormidesmis priestleyi]PSB15687.1 DoxX family membrane protein [Phormidesmis priestleyi ULC007]PZO45963.1 MAG: DoxX family membrane protein [Phormidesmis priestleyi]